MSARLEGSTKSEGRGAGGVSCDSHCRCFPDSRSHRLCGLYGRCSSSGPDPGTHTGQSYCSHRCSKTHTHLHLNSLLSYIPFLPLLVSASTHSRYFFWQTWKNTDGLKKKRKDYIHITLTWICVLSKHMWPSLDNRIMQVNTYIHTKWQGLTSWQNLPDPWKPSRHLQAVWKQQGGGDREHSLLCVDTFAFLVQLNLKFHGFGHYALISVCPPLVLKQLPLFCCSKFWLYVSERGVWFWKCHPCVWLSACLDLAGATCLTSESEPRKKTVLGCPEHAAGHLAESRDSNGKPWAWIQTNHDTDCVWRHKIKASGWENKQQLSILGFVVGKSILGNFFWRGAKILAQSYSIFWVMTLLETSPTCSFTPNPPAR